MSCYTDAEKKRKELEKLNIDFGLDNDIGLMAQLLKESNSI
jgi:hypothetical protein